MIIPSVVIAQCKPSSAGFGSQGADRRILVHVVQDNADCTLLMGCTHIVLIVMLVFTDWRGAMRKGTRPCTMSHRIRLGMQRLLNGDGRYLRRFVSYRVPFSSTRNSMKWIRRICGIPTGLFHRWISSVQRK
jgi:hypothetical protein